MEEKKKSNGKLIIAIVLIIATVIIAGLYLGIFSMPTGLAVGTQTNANENSTAPSTPQQPTFTTTGTEVIAKNVTETLPYNEPIDLESGEYSIQVLTDNPVLIRLYSQLNFKDWESSGIHGSVVTGTNLDEKDKTTIFDATFFIPNGEGGKYYLLILGNEKTSIKFKITQILKT